MDPVKSSVAAELSDIVLFQQAHPDDVAIPNSAMNYRRLLVDSVHRTAGVIGDGLKLTEHVGGGNFIDLLPGIVVLPEKTTGGGKYIGEITARMAIAIPAAQASSRTHRVIAYALDPADAGDPTGLANYGWALQVLEDSGAGTTVPAYALDVGEFTRAASAALVSNIVDHRPQIGTGSGGVKRIDQLGFTPSIGTGRISAPASVAFDAEGMIQVARITYDKLSAGSALEVRVALSGYMSAVGRVTVGVAISASGYTSTFNVIGMGYHNHPMVNAGTSGALQWFQTDNGQVTGSTANPHGHNIRTTAPGFHNHAFTTSQIHLPIIGEKLITGLAAKQYTVQVFYYVGAGYFTLDVNDYVHFRVEEVFSA